jgi:hypothetical protein
VRLSFGCFADNYGIPRRRCQSAASTAPSDCSDRRAVLPGDQFTFTCSCAQAPVAVLPDADRTIFAPCRQLPAIRRPRDSPDPSIRTEKFVNDFWNNHASKSSGWVCVLSSP